MNARKHLALAASVAILGGGFTLATASGATASAAHSSGTAEPAIQAACQTWSDGNTFGAGKCPGYSQVQATAECENGSTVAGTKVSATGWSYAYCAGKGGLVPGSGWYFLW